MIGQTRMSEELEEEWKTVVAIELGEKVSEGAGEENVAKKNEMTRNLRRNPEDKENFQDRMERETSTLRADVSKLSAKYKKLREELDELKRGDINFEGYTPRQSIDVFPGAWNMTNMGSTSMQLGSLPNSLPHMDSNLEETSLHLTRLNPHLSSLKSKRHSGYSFEGIEPEVREEILTEDMETRQIQAIADFCDVEDSTAEYYLKKHRFHPEPVVDDIEKMKDIKHSCCLYLSYGVLITFIIYFQIGYFTRFLDHQGDHVWSLSFSTHEENPSEIPIILLTTVGIDSHLVTPYTISLTKVSNDIVEPKVLCGPDQFVQNCWGNEEDALVCDDGYTTYFGDEDFSWGACRRENVSRSLCPKHAATMCANPRANMGIEYVCEYPEVCVISIHQGPRICPDGRDPSDINTMPTTCSNIIEVDSSLEWDMFIQKMNESESMIFRYETLLVIKPPMEYLSSTRDEYYVSFRIGTSSKEQPDDLQYAFRYKWYYRNQIINHGIESWAHLLTFFYGNQDEIMKEIPAGGKFEIFVLFFRWNHHEERV